MKSNEAKRIVREAWEEANRANLNIDHADIYDLQYVTGRNDSKIKTYWNFVEIKNLFGTFILLYENDIDEEPEEVLENLLEWAYTPKKKWRWGTRVD